MAWDLMKTPWIANGRIGAYRQPKPRAIDGPLYSGGDTWDEPRYWTEDVGEALAYALFGSAIPRNGLEDSFNEQVRMRETIPQIMVAPDPGSAWRLPDGRIDESLLSAWEKGEDDTLENYFLDGDPQSEAWMHDEQWGAPEHQPMPRDELEAMIQQIVDSGDDHFRWGNTGTNMPQEARRAHILGALERLQTNTRGQTYLPDEVKQFVNTSETDQITEGDDEEYLREWGRWNP